MIKYNPLTDARYDNLEFTEITETGEPFNQALESLLTDATLEGFYPFISGADGIILIFNRADGKQLLLDFSPRADMTLFTATV